MLTSCPKAVFAAVLCVFAFVTGPASAKRSVPLAVEPVTVHGVTYSAPATAMGFVVASDASSGRELWRRRIYRIHFNPSLERDVQDVFITSLTLRGEYLLIANEHGERYALDLSTRKITRETDHTAPNHAMETKGTRRSQRWLSTVSLGGEYYLRFSRDLRRKRNYAGQTEND